MKKYVKASADDSSAMTHMWEHIEFRLEEARGSIERSKDNWYDKLDKTTKKKVEQCVRDIYNLSDKLGDILDEGYNKVTK